MIVTCGKSVFQTFLLVAACVGLFAQSAQAADDCRASPAPGINWEDCDKKLIMLDSSDLSGAILARTDFTSTDLRSSNLTKANLEKAVLVRASFAGSIATGARFARIEAYRTDFSQLDALGAVFSGAELQRSIFTQAKLGDADFTKADLGTLAIRPSRCRRQPFLVGQSCARRLSRGDICQAGRFRPCFLLPHPHRRRRSDGCDRAHPVAGGHGLRRCANKAAGRS